jgi:branched-chain amino acid transport system ATP-binding protein
VVSSDLSPSPFLLEVRGLTRRYGGLVALSDYSLDLPAGRIHGVIGPNGAGKTTLFNLLSKMVLPTAGTIHLDGVDITRLPAYRVARMGIARTFQNIRLFDDLSAIDNVKVAVQGHVQRSFWGTLLTTPAFRRHEAEIEARARAMLELVGLAHRADREAGSLPYGEQRRLEIGRAVAVQPRILMLDEPNAGMNPAETSDLLALVRRVRDELGITIILVAHDIPLVMNLCDRIQVLNFGQLIAEGEPAEVRTNAEVIAAYLGQARHAATHTGDHGAEQHGAGPPAGNAPHA